MIDILKNIVDAFYSFIDSTLADLIIRCNGDCVLAALVLTTEFTIGAIILILIKYLLEELVCYLKTIVKEK